MKNKNIYCALYNIKSHTLIKFVDIIHNMIELRIQLIFPFTIFYIFYVLKN